MNAALKEKFEAITLHHMDAVYRIALALSCREAEAEDLVQETYIRAYKAFERFELRDYGARPWLLRILHNVFYTNWSKQQRGPSLLDDIDLNHFADELESSDTNPLSATVFEWEYFDEELKEAVGELLPEYRSVLLLWAIEGLTYREIAEVCEVAIGTVMSRLYRARQLLGRHLGEYAREHRINTKRVKP